MEEASDGPKTSSQDARGRRAEAQGMKGRGWVRLGWFAYVIASLLCLFAILIELPSNSI